MGWAGLGRAGADTHVYVNIPHININEKRAQVTVKGEDGRGHILTFPGRKGSLKTAGEVIVCKCFFGRVAEAVVGWGGEKGREGGREAEMKCVDSVDA